MIVFSVSILLIVVGIYSMWTKNPNFAPEENSDQILNSEQYGDYVRKIGIIYLAIGVVLFLLELINVIWMIPTIIRFLILVGFLVPLFNYYHSLHKRYFKQFKSGMKQDNED